MSCVYQPTNQFDFPPVRETISVKNCLSQHFPLRVLQTLFSNHSRRHFISSFAFFFYLHFFLPELNILTDAWLGVLVPFSSYLVYRHLDFVYETTTKAKEQIIFEVQSISYEENLDVTELELATSGLWSKHTITLSCRSIFRRSVQLNILVLLFFISSLLTGV